MSDAKSCTCEEPQSREVCVCVCMYTRMSKQDQWNNPIVCNMIEAGPAELFENRSKKLTEMMLPSARW